MLPPELISEDAHSTIRDALRALDKRQLVLGVHGPSLPSLEDEDTGRGTPYSAGASRYFAFVRQLGFTAVQLGPMGQTSADNASPYDGTLFAANILDLWLPALVDGPLGGLLPERVAQALVSQAPAGGRSRVDHPRVFSAQRAALELAFTSFQRMRARDEAAHLPVQAVDAFAAQHRDWLEPHALYEVLCREHRAGWYREWRTSSGAPHSDQRLYAPAPGEEALQSARREQLLAGSRTALDFHAFTQWVLWAQHAGLRSYLQRLGLSLFGDLQVGPSPEDAWASARAFLPGYLLGAPPSRTNPEGQPWGYPVLAPDAWTSADGTPGPAQAMLRARLERMFGAYDGVRVDHPHGWVCPWVYDADALVPLQAVQHGARLFASPALEDHPALARFALVRPDQLAPPGATPRHADDWVRSLEPAQEDAYARAVDLMVELAKSHGRQRQDLAFEVLSTQPYPLARVLARHGLGRFRVTQKADPRRPDDVYRTENARPEDWVMVGSHDTPPLAQMLQRWAADPEVWREQAALRAHHLEPVPGKRQALARSLAADPRRLWEATFAELFCSRAQNVSVFFTDLYGVAETFNEPGTVSPENWTLRVPQPAEQSYAEALAAGRGLNLPRVLALAMKGRGEDFARGHAPLIAALDRQARALEPSLPAE